jgi:hypothetical protein
MYRHIKSGFDVQRIQNAEDSIKFATGLKTEAEATVLVSIHKFLALKVGCYSKPAPCLEAISLDRCYLGV